MSSGTNENRKQELRNNQKELTPKQIKKQLSRNGYGKGTFFETEMYTSKAWLSLNNMGKILLVLFLGKRDIRSVKNHKGIKTKACLNCDNLTMTYKELEGAPFFFTRPRIIRGIDDLLAKGFVKVIHLGGCYQKDKTVYALIDDWLLWKPGAEIRKRQHDVKRGYQGKRIGAVKNKTKAARLSLVKEPN